MAEIYQIDETSGIQITAQMLMKADSIPEAAGHDPATALLLGIKIDEVGPIVSILGNKKLIESAYSSLDTPKEKLKNLGEIDIDWNGRLNIVEIANGILKHFEFKDKAEMCEVMFAFGFLCRCFLDEKLSNLQ